MQPEDVDVRVQDAVRAWGRAPSSEEGARRLADARRALPAELRPQLLAEVAEISAETMIRLVRRPSGVDRIPLEALEVEGFALSPREADRLAAWAQDQKRTAEALGQSPRAWRRALEAGFDRHRARGRGDAERPRTGAPPGDRAEQARRLLSCEKPRFENRPAPGTSAKAGIGGVVAARSFGVAPRRSSGRMRRLRSAIRDVDSGS